MSRPPHRRSFAGDGAAVPYPGPDWFDYPWGTVDHANASAVHAGSKSIRVSPKAREGIVLAHDDLDTAPGWGFSFWVHHGPAGGQLLQAIAVLRMQSRPPVALEPLLTLTQDLLVLPESFVGGRLTIRVGL